MAAKPDVLKWYRMIKENDVCTRCGIHHPAIIEYHHKDPSQKRMSVSQMVHNGAELIDVRAEMSICEALCKNCHAIVHWDQEHGHHRQYGTHMVLEIARNRAA